MKRFVSIGGLVFLMVMAQFAPVHSLTPGSGKVRVEVAGSGHVEGPVIFLKDVAKVSADPLLKEVVESISLGRSPKPGTIKTITRARVMSKIRSQSDLPENSSILVPDKVYVKRTSQSIHTTGIRQEVDSFVESYFQGRDYGFRSVKIEKSALYPSGQLEMIVVPRQGGQGVDRNGNLSLSVDILVDGERVDSIRVSGKVAVYENVACAARDLVRGEPVLEGDVVWVRKDIFSTRGSLIKNLQAMEGVLLKTDVPKNSPIKSGWLAARPLIHKGDVITLVARKNNLVILASGISREDGFKNKMIRVENMGSGKVVRGLVRKASTVEVIY